jgi:adenosine deaminase
MNENLLALQDEGGLTRSEIVQLVRNGFEVAWIPEDRRNQYLKALNQYVDAAA